MCLCRRVIQRSSSSSSSTSFSRASPIPLVSYLAEEQQENSEEHVRETSPALACHSECKVEFTPCMYRINILISVVRFTALDNIHILISIVKFTSGAAKYSAIGPEMDGLLVDVVLDGQQIVAHGLEGELMQDGGHWVKRPVQDYQLRAGLVWTLQKKGGKRKDRRRQHVSFGGISDI